MSVSAEQKQEIITSTYKSSCCRRALLYGVLFAKATAEGKRVTLSLEKAEYAEFLSKLIQEFYSKNVEIFRSSKGGRKVYLSFESPSATKYISEIASLEALDVNKIFYPKCTSCLSSFLRGVFVACGRLSDPEKQYSLEFTLGDRAELFADILKNLEMSPLLFNKKTGKTVSFRKGDEIESFCGHARLNGVMFGVIERKITTLARRESQRYLNCVTKNYDRMTAASERQISIITKLDELNLLSSLPEELAVTARMRLDYPDLPLSALAAKMVPAVTKSGLSHRLKRIEKLGESLVFHEDD